MPETKRIQCITDDSGNEAIYCDGKLFMSDDTIYARDIAVCASGSPVIFSHNCVTLGDDELWPQDFDDLKDRLDKE